METPSLGTNVTKMEGGKGTQAELEARVKSFESPEPQPEVMTPPTEAQVPAETPPPAPPAEATKVDSLQQFKDKEGNVSEEKILKANEHLKKGIKERTEKLLAENKALREKFRQAGVQVNSSEKKSFELPIDDLPKTALPPDLKNKILEGLEKDPVETILSLVNGVSQQAIAPVIKDTEAMKRDHEQGKTMRELDDLISEGHDWIATEGLGRFDAVFRENPWILNSPNPYKAAVRFMDPPERQPTQAQVGAKTPILGANRAVPPPSQVPPVSPEQESANLSIALRTALREKDWAKAAEIEKQMDTMFKGRFA